MSDTVPHGSVGAVAGRRAIAQGNPDEVAAALCRYSAPEEVRAAILHSANLKFKLFISVELHTPYKLDMGQNLLPSYIPL